MKLYNIQSSIMNIVYAIFRHEDSSVSSRRMNDAYLFLKCKENNFGIIDKQALFVWQMSC